MKRTLATLLTLSVTAAILYAGALLLIPDQVADLQRRLGLPAPPLTRQEEPALPLARPQEIRLYGTLEARATHVMSELDGQAVAVLVEEGEWVEAGQPLLLLDPTDVLAQLAAGQEAVAAAEAARDAVAAPPDETVRALADRSVEAARTELFNARRSLVQALVVRENPLALQARIDQTAALIPVAQARVDAAQAGVKQAQVLIEDARTDLSREGKYRVRILEAQKAAAEEELNAARAQLNGLQRTLAQLQAMLEEPLELIAQVHQAQNQVKLAEAALAVAEAERALQVAPPQPEAVAVAQADVRKAQAALDLVRWQEERLTVTAPASGRVQERAVAVGEAVKAGAPLMAIVDTSQMELWAYVAAQDLHRVRLGDWLPVEVLAIPGERFQGRVFFIASQAQFRPSNVLNPEDRGDMVFLIKLALDNGDGRLKPGMPADVILGGNR